MKIAAAYIRVSTEDQSEYSPDAQLREIRRWAAREGYQIPPEQVYLDDGVSGKHTARRSAFNRMIAAARSQPKPFEAILLWKYSRFARNREDSVVYKSLLRRELGIEVISVSEPVGDDKMSVLFEALIEAMDEYYSVNLAEEVRRGMSEKARRGEPQCAPPFGYRMENNLLRPVPQQAEAVRLLYRAYDQGCGFRALAQQLNALGLRTGRGNRFDSRAVEYILRNPVYAGLLRWNPAGHTGRTFDREGLICAAANHEPLVELTLWQRVQERATALKNRGGAAATGAVERSGDCLSGLIRCAVCGGTLVFVRPHYYRCNNNIRGRCTHTQHISADLLKEALFARLQADFAAADALSWRTPPAPPNARAERRTLLQTALAALERRADRARELYLCGADTLEDYTAERSRITAERIRLRTELETAADVGGARDETDAGQRFDAGLRTLGLEEAPPEALNRALRVILQRCTFDREAGLLVLTYRPAVDLPPVQGV